MLEDKKKSQLFCEWFSGKFSSAFYFLIIQKNWKNVLVSDEISGIF